MLSKVWMQVGLEKVDSHEEVSVKALLDNSTTGMFADKKFMEKNGFKLDVMNRSFHQVFYHYSFLFFYFLFYL